MWFPRGLNISISPDLAITASNHKAEKKKTRIKRDSGELIGNRPKPEMTPTRGNYVFPTTPRQNVQEGY